jgi:L-2-hydroxycarboxylate dehydrogenase (NAD+)
MAKEGFLRVFAPDARDLIIEVLTELGAPVDAAGHQADQLVEGDLRDRPSHGIQRLPVIVQRIRRRLIDPAARPRLNWVRDGLLQVDGRFGLGPPVAVTAIEHLVERARGAGIALGVIARAGHLGMLAPYLERAVDSGVMAVAMTTSEALVHPHGGRTALIGTNPVGIAVPTGDAEPFILDMATGAISMGAVIAAAHRGDSLPVGVAVDAAGAPTTDPHAARAGAISPIGGPKGYGLGLGIELLVGLLSGTALGTDVRGTLDAEHPVSKGDMFLIVDPSVLGAADLSARAASFLAQVRRSPRAADATGPVTTPGQRSRRIRRLRLTDGYDIPLGVWERALALRAEASSGAPCA